ncbi:hypothetical protein E2C01_043728 [Portunus trituberculatus]|uniref:Uncharacterized protein n=1 Tax=Portunus trituberculatus TaxID=210409 RepID=A0A5B7FY35_PORTR|nr:hypothetical protein [Portunus trituberculatus]
METRLLRLSTLISRSANIQKITEHVVANISSETLKTVTCGAGDIAVSFISLHSYIKVFITFAGSVNEGDWGREGTDIKVSRVRKRCEGKDKVRTGNYCDRPGTATLRLVRCFSLWIRMRLKE